MVVVVLLCLLSLVASQTQEQKECPIEIIDNIHYINDQNFDCYLSDLSVPFLFNYCDNRANCNDVKEKLIRLAKEFDGRLKVSISYEFGNVKTMRRLSVPHFPTFFYTQDGQYFIIYYWPREYEDIVRFVTEGYKKVPKERHRYLDPVSLHQYLYDSFFYWLERAGDKVDSTMSSFGFGWMSGIVKAGLVVTIVGGTTLLFILQLYECYKVQKELSTYWTKKKTA